MAVYANLNIDQGANFDSIVTVEGGNGLPFNLANYSARGQIRKTYTSSTAYNFTASINDADAGEIRLILGNGTTGSMKPGRYVFDVEIYTDNDNDVIRVIEGQVEISPGVTR
jgi:hypothetical protein